jgi:hypothetical protein
MFFHSLVESHAAALWLLKQHHAKLGKANQH